MGVFRRSELVRIRVEDIAPHPRGLSITIPFSKGDQAGVGQSVAILEGRRIEPVRHLRAWIEAARISAGTVFRRLTPHGRVTDAALSEQSVALVVKKRAAAVGYHPRCSLGTACAPASWPRRGVPVRRCSRCRNTAGTSRSICSAPMSGTRSLSQPCRGRVRVIAIGIATGAGVWGTDAMAFAPDSSPAGELPGLQITLTSLEIGR
jgi:hypothetical protein